MESKKEVNWAPLDDGDKNSILALRLGFRVQGSVQTDRQTEASIVRGQLQIMSMSFRIEYYSLLGGGVIKPSATAMYRPRKSEETAINVIMDFVDTGLRRLPSSALHNSWSSSIA